MVDRIKKEGEEGRDIANHFDIYNVWCMWEEGAGSMNILLFNWSTKVQAPCLQAFTLLKCP